MSVIFSFDNFSFADCTMKYTYALRFSHLMEGQRNLGENRVKSQTPETVTKAASCEYLCPKDE